MSFTLFESKGAVRRAQGGAVLLLALAAALLWLAARLFGRDWWTVAAVAAGIAGVAIALAAILLLVMASSARPAR